MNRVIRVDQDGWAMEADQRHVDILIKEMNLKGAKGVSTPSEEEKRYEEEENRVELDPREARKYRELAARANYLGQDRADAQCAIKEVCRGCGLQRKGTTRSCDVSPDTSCRFPGRR